jgi:hypothetical protein
MIRLSSRPGVDVWIDLRSFSATASNCFCSRSLIAFATS